MDNEDLQDFSEDVGATLDYITNNATSEEFERVVDVAKSGALSLEGLEQQTEQQEQLSQTEREFIETVWGADSDVFELAKENMMADRKQEQYEQELEEFEEDRRYYSGDKFAIRDMSKNDFEDLLAKVKSGEVKSIHEEYQPSQQELYNQARNEALEDLYNSLEQDRYVQSASIEEVNSAAALINESNNINTQLYNIANEYQNLKDYYNSNIKYATQQDYQEVVAYAEQLTQAYNNLLFYKDVVNDNMSRFMRGRRGY